MGNYPPKEYQDDNKAHLIEVIKKYPLATLISIKDNIPFITHLPLIYSEGRLIGHLDRQNPHAKLLKNRESVTVIFSGPDCYISPSIFSAEALPTWNYIKVHLEGTVTEIERPENIMASMITMTAFMEAPSPKYELKPDNPRMSQLIHYVQGFEIDIQHWEGKLKLSQDKSPEDMKSASQALIKSTQKNVSLFLSELLDLNL